MIDVVCADRTPKSAPPNPGQVRMPEEFAPAGVSHLFPRRYGHARETIDIMRGIRNDDLFEYRGEFVAFPLSGFEHSGFEHSGFGHRRCRDAGLTLPRLDAS